MQVYLDGVEVETAEGDTLEALVERNLGPDILPDVVEPLHTVSDHRRKYRLALSAVSVLGMLRLIVGDAADAHALEVWCERAHEGRAGVWIPLRPCPRTSMMAVRRYCLPRRAGRRAGAADGRVLWVRPAAPSDDDGIVQTRTYPLRELVPWGTPRADRHPYDRERAVVSHILREAHRYRFMCNGRELALGDALDLAEGDRIELVR